MPPASTSSPSRPLRSLEIFSGAGGLAIATHLAGFTHEAVVEWNKDACLTLRENSAGLAGEAWNVIEGDIRDVDASRFDGLDLLAGGPPCQPFSLGGRHQGNGDARDMIPQFIRCVRQARPRAFIMENVKGLTRPAFRNYFSYTLLQLSYPEITRRPSESDTDHLSRLESIHTKGRSRRLTYHVTARVLNAADYGVPQTRERVFLVGFRADQNIPWHFPDPTHSREALLFEQWGSGRYWKRLGLKPAARSGPAFRIPETRPPLAPWRTIRETIADLPPPLDRESNRVLNHRLQPGARPYPGHTGSPLDWPSKTLKAGDHGVPGGENMIVFPDGSVRYLTVREAARVQTFPDGWLLRGAWSEAMRQLGNAVPVELARVVARDVAAALTAG